MSKDFFTIPVYTDKMDQIQRLNKTNEVVHFVFLKAEDYSQENADLLRKILSAVQLDVQASVQVFLLKDEEHVFLMEELDLSKANYFFAFGLNAKRIGLQCRTIPYKWMSFSTLNVLFSHALTDLYKSNDLKKKLWSCLKQMGNK